MADRIYAPYARAAAVVDRDGTLLRAKNVTAVRKGGVGEYYVTVADTIDARTAAFQMTADNGAHWGTEVYATSKGDENHVIKVVTGRNGAAADEPFHLAIL